MNPVRLIRRDWSEERLAWAAYFAGLGRSAAEIAGSIKVDSTPGAVRQKLSRAGVPILDAQGAKRRIVVDAVMPSTLESLSAIAFDMDMTREELVWRLLESIGSDPCGGNLVRNILAE